MATQLKKFDWSKIGTGGSKYPWDQWLNGKPWKLMRGKDFDRAADSLRASVSAAAKRRGMTCRMTKPDDKTLIIQAFALAESAA